MRPKSLRRCMRYGVDALLLVLLLFLMSYPVTRGLLRHGVCGVLFLALLLVHLALNCGWFCSLFKGRWNRSRLLLTAADTALLAAGLLLAASSLAMAGEVFSFAPFPMTFWGRGLHTAASAWTFVLAAFHLGLHCQAVIRRIERACGRLRLPLRLTVLLAVLFAGGFSFFESGLLGSMLFLDVYKPQAADPAAFLAQCLGVVLFAGLAAQILNRSLNTSFLCKKHTGD